MAQLGHFPIIFFSPWDRIKMAPSPCAILVYIVFGVILGHFDVIRSMANEILCAILSWHKTLENIHQPPKSQTHQVFRHLSVAEFGHSLLIFNHPCVITSFFPPSNFGDEPRLAKNWSKVVIFEKENWTKKTHFLNSTFWVYMQYMPCVPS